MKKTTNLISKTGKTKRKRSHGMAALPLCLGLITLTAPLVSQAESPVVSSHRFNITPQPMYSALSRLAEQSGVQFVYNSAMVKGLTSPGVNGNYTLMGALSKLLAGSGIAYQVGGGNTVVLKNMLMPVAATTASEPQSATTLPQVKVIGKVEYDDTGPYNTSYTADHSSIAAKTDTPIMDTPMSIQVVPKQVLQDQQAYRLQDALKNVSGVQQQYIYGGFDSFIVRGFELGQFQYRNGVRIPGLNLDLANVRQVEVLKGPASGLYGRIEPGGLINLVTKRPLEESYYSLEQRFGSFDYYRTQASATGAVNADKSLLYGVDLSYLNSGSFREHSFNDRVFFAPSLTWKPFDNTEANLTVEYLNEDRVYDSGLPATDTGILDVPITRQLDNPGLSDTHEYVLVDFNWSHQFNNAWKIQNGVVSLHSNFDENETYTWGYNPGNRTIGRYAWFGNEQTDLNTVYLNLTGKFDTYGVKHSILAGADYFNQQSLGYGTDNFVDAVNVDHPVYVSNQSLFAQYGNLPLEYFRDRQGGWYNDQENSWYGLYFQDQMAFFDDRLLIMGGGRYDWANVDKAGAYFSDLSTDALQDGQFSPRVGITVRPWQWLAVYGNYMESFGTNNGRSVTGEIFAPQAAKQYEAGIKTEFFDGRLNSTLAYYHLTKTNVVTKLDNSQFDQAVGEARSQGIEFDLSGQLTDDLNLITTYAFTDARVTKDSFAILGNRLPYVPGHSGSVWLKYAFPQAMLQGFSVGAGVYAASEREGNVTNTYRDGAYARLDLFGAYTHKLAGHKLTTQVNLYNVSDSEYYLMRNQSQNLPAEPLTVFGSVRLEY